jgi:RNA-splicing ligase RtcB
MANAGIIVHCNGATPAGAGVLGIIPGSMASPGYIVRGKGSPESLHSASHGAGRVMSRTKAMQSFTWSATKKLETVSRGPNCGRSSRFEKNCVEQF